MTSDLSQIGFLLFISALVAMLTRRLRLPYTVGLVLAGMGAHLANVRFQLHLTKDLIFSIFLPPLVFEAALCIRWAEFKQDLPVVGALATVGVVLAAVVTAFCGPIACIGVAVPHLCRGLLATGDHRVVVPAVVLMGAGVAVIAQVASVLPGDGSVLPLNAVTALIGAPTVVMVLLRARRLRVAP